MAWLTLDVVEVLKTCDETAWEIAESEYLDGLEKDEEVLPSTMVTLLLDV